MHALQFAQEILQLVAGPKVPIETLTYVYQVETSISGFWPTYKESWMDAISAGTAHTYSQPYLQQEINIAYIYIALRKYEIMHSKSKLQWGISTPRVSVNH